MEYNNISNHEMGDKLSRKLYVKQYDRMVKDLVNQIKNNEIILNPEYQRNYVWDNNKASRLIESILLNIPIPVIYASEDSNSNWIIVDGLQRLNSLTRFYNDEFKLTGLETLTEYNGKKYSTIGEKVRNIIDRGELRVILLLNSSDYEIQYDIFLRLNTGSVKLTEQELRNCLFRGKLNDLVKKTLATDPITIKLIGNNNKRMAVNEVILRYFAVSEYYDRSNEVINKYDGRIKNLINRFMAEYLNPDDSILNTFKEKYLTNMNKIDAIYGSIAFRKLADVKYETNINSPLMECMMIAIEKYSLDALLLKKEEILIKHKLLLQDHEFVKYIDKATGNTNATNNRIKKYNAMIKNIMEN